MARGRIRRGGEYAQVWPGYVDVLSTLLLVVTFLMSIFMLAQYFASQEASGKDTALKKLTLQITELTNLLALEKGKGKSAEDELAALQASLAALKEENTKLSGSALSGDELAKNAQARIAGLSADLENQKNISNEALAKVDLLNQQLLALRRQIAALNDALEASEKKDAESQSRIKDLGARLNAALARQVQELQRYRSDFFGRLRELLKNRKDIRVVGDRFVFESEVLFASGSDALTPEGQRRWTSSRLPSSSSARQIPPGDRLGAAGQRPHRHPSDRKPNLPIELGAVDRARDRRGALSDQARGAATAAGGGRVWRVPAAGARQGRGEPAAQPPHRAQADEPLASTAERLATEYPHTRLAP